MSRVKGLGNERTELALVKLFRRHKVRGWRRRFSLFGKPDFVFPRARVAVFVDGCFWHSCKEHGSLPHSNRAFWRAKLERNKARDLLVNRALGQRGWIVIRVWQHELTQSAGAACVTRIRKTLAECAGPRPRLPQFRKRSILLAVREDVVRSDRLADLLGTELLVPNSDPDATMVSVREALSHLPPVAAGDEHPKIPNHRTRTLSELNLKRLAAAKPGASNAYMEQTKFGDLSLDCHRKVNRRLRVRCFSDVYTRMHPDRPSPTITTKCHSISNGRFGHYDIRQMRGISLREAAVLQSFPTGYVFYPKDQIEPVARMIGNAVPPKLAAYFAEYLANSVEP